MADDKKAQADQKAQAQADQKAQAESDQTAQADQAEADDDDPSEENNSLDTKNEAYVGASPEYQNHAYDNMVPMLASEDSDEGKAEREAIASVKELESNSDNITSQGFTSSDPMSRFDKEDEDK